jgi:hypothetical protein
MTLDKYQKVTAVIFALGIFMFLLGIYDTVIHHTKKDQYNICVQTSSAITDIEVQHVDIHCREVTGYRMPRL